MAGRASVRRKAIVAMGFMIYRIQFRPMRAQKVLLTTICGFHNAVMVSASRTYLLLRKWALSILEYSLSVEADSLKSPARTTHSHYQLQFKGI